MPKTLEELASMISERDKISYTDAMAAVRDCAADMEYAFSMEILILQNKF